jgi:tape measure domain-containing protein
MSTNVGGIYFDVSLDTSKLIEGQRKVDAELGKTSASLDGFKSKLTAVASAVGILGVAMAAVKAANFADDMRMLSVRVNIAAGSMDAGSVAMAKLIDISRNAQTSVQATAEVFARLNSSIKAMGGTQTDTLRLTETLAKAIKVSGASAEEAKNAMLQFGQAMGSGKLQGDELRSLMENAPYLMQKMAQGIGVPVGALKKLGEQGKLTADVVAEALQKASAQIESDFDQLPKTVSAAFAQMEDAAKRANEKFDELTGTSTILAGASRGLAEVIDELGKQFGAANTEAGTLGRNTAIKEWADDTKIALSYVVDAADMVWQTVSVLGRNVAFVFKAVGTEIGGIAAQASSVARGDFAGAKAIGQMMVADAAKRRAELDSADAKALGKEKLAGQQMREAWAAGYGGGRGRINPEQAPSKLKAPQGSDKPDGPAKKKFDSEAYLSDLRKAADDELAVINETEAEKLRVAAKHYAAHEISEREYQSAILEIKKAAASDRAKLADKEQKTLREKKLKEYEQDIEDAVAIAKEIRDARERENSIIGQVDPAAALRMDYEKRLAVVVEYEELMRAAGIDSTQKANDAREAIEKDYADKRLALAVSSAKGVEGVILKSFDKMGDAAIEFMHTGKASFRDLFGFMADEFIRNQMRMLQTQAMNAMSGGGGGGLLGILGGLGNMFTGGGIAGSASIAGAVGGETLNNFIINGAFANGGDPAVGKWSLVGEKGPELIRPRSAMTVIPNGKMSNALGASASSSSGGAPQYIFNNPITITGNGVTMQDVQMAQRQSETRIKASILQSRNRGGRFE